MRSHIRTIGNPDWETEAWYPEKPTLQETAKVGDGVMAQQDADNDKADADARKPNDTPERLQRNAESENEAAATMEKKDTNPP